MPASIKQSELFVFTDQVLVLLCLPRSIKGGMLAKPCMKSMLRENTERSSVQQGKPDPCNLWRPKDNQHKAQISSITLFNRY